MSSSIRIATWNLWWRFGDPEARQPRITKVLQEVDADIVCLQEVYLSEADQPDDQAKRLTGELGLAEFRWADGFFWDRFHFGNAVLSRWPITKHAITPLPVSEPSSEEQRTVLVCEVEHPDGPIVVATTHLNFKWDQSADRQVQAEAICQVLDGWRPFTFPPILTGDLNADPDSDEIRMLTGRRASPVKALGFFDAYETAGVGPAPTFARDNPLTQRVEPDRRIDYVLVGHPIEGRGVTMSARRFGDVAVDGGFASDHYGVVADVRLDAQP